MYNITLIDQEQAIIGIKWEKTLSPAGIQQANQDIDRILKEQSYSSFDLIVDMKDVVVFKPETQKEIVVHQAWLKERGMNRAAVIVKSSVAKLQLKRTARESSHTTEQHFVDYEEAVAFLKGHKAII